MCRAGHDVRDVLQEHRGNQVHRPLRALLRHSRAVLPPARGDGQRRSADQEHDEQPSENAGLDPGRLAS